MFFTLRKLIFIFFIFLNFFLIKDSVFALGTTKTIQKDGLVTHFTFDSDYIFGTTTYDKTNRRNNGVMVNGPSVTNGKFGQGMLFNGNDSYVTIPTTGASTTTGSISFWAHATTTQVSGYLVNTVGTGQRIYFNYTSSNTIDMVLGSTPTFIAGISAPLGKWYHVVGKWNGVVGTLYVNGVFVGSSTFSGLTSILNPMYIGSFAGSQGFKGIIDDVRFFNKDLSSSEILSLYKTGTNISVKNSNNLNLAGYWPLNENYSSDYSGKRNNFTVNGTCLSTSSDSVSGGVSITGWGGCGTSPNLLGYFSLDDVLNSASEFTFTAWIKGSGVLWSGATTFWLQTTATGAYLQKYTGSWVTIASGDGGGTSSSWRQVVVTKNSAGGVKIYSNGIEIASSTTETFYTPTSHTFGRYAVYDDGGYHFSGKIDEVRMYKRVLSLSEIKDLYKIKPAAVNTSKIKVDNSLSGPILHYTFDGPRLNSSTSTDSGSTGANGTLVGTLRSAVGRIGQSLNFDGTSGYISVGSNMANNDMTIATWIKPRTTAGYIATEGVINSGIRYYLNFNSNKINWSCYNGGYYTAVSNNDIQTDKWTHVVGTIKSGETGGLKLYINGVLQSSSSTIAACGSYGTLYIGSYIWPISNYFNGLMDDFRVYNRSLSQAEITKLYQLGGR